jgi:hypothetical protein
MSHSVPRRRTLLLLAAGVLAAACTRPLPPPADGTVPQPPQTVESSGLVSSLRVETGDTVVLTLQVTNPSAAPMVFNFTSGQMYDFAVRTAAGAEVWRWSADRGVTQAVQPRTLGPGETWTFTERWTPPAGLRGELSVTGRLGPSDRPLVGRATIFRLP